MGLPERRSIRRKRRERNLVDSSHHRLNSDAVPRPRPLCVAQVFENEQRTLAVIVPAKQPWNERSFECGVHLVLATQPLHQERLDGRLHESATTVGEPDREPVGSRIAAWPLNIVDRA